LQIQADRKVAVEADRELGAQAQPVQSQLAKDA
jgi:hypothetical protein